MHGAVEDVSIIDDNLDSASTTMIRTEWARQLRPPPADFDPCVKPLYRERVRADGVVEYVWASGQRVVISTEPDGAIHAVRHTDFPIVDVLWLTFPAHTAAPVSSSLAPSPTPCPPLECLCLVGHTAIDFIATHDNHCYNFAVPFKLRGVFPTSLGLILEREKINSQEENRLMLPHVFSLSHPYNEMVPVLYTPKDSGEWVYSWGEREDLRVVGGESDWLVAHDTTNKQHRLFRVRPSSSTEWQTARRAELMRTPITSRFDHTVPGSADTARWGGGGLSVRTRSMTAARLAKALPFPSHHSPSVTGRFTPRSSVVSSGGGVGEESPALTATRMRGRMWTPRQLSVEEDDRVSVVEMELLVAEICLDCVWVEPKHRDGDGYAPANKVFLSSDLISHQYLNLLSVPLPDSSSSASSSPAPSGQLRSIRLVRSANLHTVSGQVHTVACRDAAYVKSEGVTVVVDPSDGSLSLYTGVQRVAVLVVSTPFPSVAVSLSPGCASSVLLECEGGGGERATVRAKLPPMFATSQGRRVWQCVADSLPYEKAIRLASEWRVHAGIAHTGNGVCGETAETVDLVRFLFHAIGLTFTNHPLFHKPADSDDSMECDAPKHKRGPTSASENWRQVLMSIGRMDASGEVKEEKEKGEKEQREQKRMKGGAERRKKDTVRISYSLSSTPSLHSHVYSVLQSLHSAYEECKMDRREAPVQRLLAEAMHAAASAHNVPAYALAYMCDYPYLMTYRYDKHKDSADPPAPPGRGWSSEKVFSVWSSVERLLACPQPSSTIAASNDTLKWLVGMAIGVCRVSNGVDMARVFGKGWPKRLHADAECEKSILSVLHDRTLTPPEKAEKVLISLGCSAWQVQLAPPAIGLLLGDILKRQSSPSSLVRPESKHNAALFEVPSVAERSRVHLVRWRRDVRCANAASLLDATRPVYVPAKSGGSEAEIRDAQENFLLNVSIRTMALAFGRALMQFRTCMPAANEALVVAGVCYAGRQHPNNIPIDVMVNDMCRSQRDWAEFYNGAAAGVRVCGSDAVFLDGEWLAMCNAAYQNSPTAAGLLFGLGLNGHIVHLNMFVVHELITAPDSLKMLAMSILLGFSIAQAGTRDLQVHKMLVPHLPFLLGPTLLDIVVDPLVQTAALFSMGMLFAQSCNVSIIMQIINEMCRDPCAETEPAADRYAYTLSAGFAIGLIALGKGDVLCTSDVPFERKAPQLSQRLVVLMNGGPTAQCVTSSVAPSSVDMDVSSVAAPTATSPLPPNKSTHVYHGPNANPHLTSHPAAIALGLMYLKTNNAAMAAELSLPDTIPLLEQIRPDVMCVRVLARSLIMWDSVECTPEWIEKQIPSCALTFTHAVFKLGDSETTTTTKEYMEWEKIVDLETVAQTYVYCVAGACLSIGLKWASTGNDQAFDAVWRHLLVLCADPHRPYRFRQLCDKAGAAAVALARDTVLSSLAMIMCGTGRLDVMRVARLLRANEEMHLWGKQFYAHSQQAAAHSAIGLLFMGDARYGLKRDALSLACLVVAFYPLTCRGIDDNRQLLQPLRLVWARACEPRLLCAIDEATGEEIRADVVVEYVDDRTLSTSVTGPTLLRSPCCLPPLDIVRKVTVRDTRYETITWEMNERGKVEELQEILSRQHGRMQMRAMRGEKHVSTTRMADYEQDLMRTDRRDEMLDHHVDVLSSLTADLDLTHGRKEVVENGVSSESEEWMSGMDRHSSAQYLDVLIKGVTRSSEECASGLRDAHLTALLAATRPCAVSAEVCGRLDSLSHIMADAVSSCEMDNVVSGECVSAAGSSVSARLVRASGGTEEETVARLRIRSCEDQIL